MRIHIVQKGDTLWTIAKKYGVNFDELKRLNAQLSNPDLIMAGMKIRVPTPAGPSKKEMPMTSKEAPVSPPPVPIKEQPEQVSPVEEQPVMPPLPPVVPEVEINQVFQMNMEQVQKTVQPPPPSPPIKPDNIFPGLDKKEEIMESPSKPVAPPPMPEIEMAPQLQGGYNYPMNANVSQYQMAPQVQSYG
ncbi:MAG TPA: SafA/ExsA family spore coat assembly protein, partial [Pseudobacillus sp.]